MADIQQAFIGQLNQEAVKKTTRKEQPNNTLVCLTLIHDLQLLHQNMLTLTPANPPNVGGF